MFKHMYFLPKIGFYNTNTYLDKYVNKCKFYDRSIHWITKEGDKPATLGEKTLVLPRRDLNCMYLFNYIFKM